MLFHIYTSFGFEISYEYLPGGLEPANGEIIPKIKLEKWRLIGIIFPWEVSPPWYVFICPPRPTQCDIPIEKIDVFKEVLRAIGWSHMNTYQDGWTSQGKITLIKHHFTSLIFRNFACLMCAYLKKGKVLQCAICVILFFIWKRLYCKIFLTALVYL